MNRGDPLESPRALPSDERNRARYRYWMAHIKLVHPVPIVFVLLATISLSYAIDPTQVFTTRIWLVLSILGGQLAVGAANELADLELDRISKPDKPLVTSEVSLRAAWIVLWSGIAVMLVASLPLGIGALLLCSAGNGLGIAYSIWFKRTIFAWLPYVLALPLLPVWIVVALGSASYEMLLLFPLGACALISVQIAQSIPDVEADRQAGIDSLTTRLGETRSLFMVWTALVVSALFVTVGVDLVRTTSILVGIVLLLVFSHAILYPVREKAGVRLAFPMAALATLLLGLVWVLGQ